MPAGAGAEEVSCRWSSPRSESFRQKGCILTNSEKPLNEAAPKEQSLEFQDRISQVHKQRKTIGLYVVLLFFICFF